jgi:hypothetical protein
MPGSSGMRVSLFIAVFSIISGSSSAGPVNLLPSGSKWITLGNVGVGEFTLYRRYAFNLADETQSMPNVWIMSCPGPNNNSYPHLDLVLPKMFGVRSFRRDNWIPKLTVRFLIDGGYSVTMEGEYQDGEIFFDDRPGQESQFKQVLGAKELSIGFGEENDIISFAFSGKVDGILADMLKRSETARTAGQMTSYDTLTMEKRCGI